MAAYQCCRKCGGALINAGYCQHCGSQPDYKTPGGLLRVVKNVTAGLRPAKFNMGRKVQEGDDGV